MLTALFEMYYFVWFVLYSLQVLFELACDFEYKHPIKS